MPPPEFQTSLGIPPDFSTEKFSPNFSPKNKTPACKKHFCLFPFSQGQKSLNESCAGTICSGKFPSFCKASVPIPPTYIPGLRENKITSAGRSAVPQVEIQERGKGLQEKSQAWKSLLEKFCTPSSTISSLRSILSSSSFA